MDKHFDFNGTVAADIAHFLPAQLPAQHHPGDAHRRTEQHAAQAMHRHLGRAVDGDFRRNAAAHLHHAQVLDDEGVHAAGSGMADQFGAFIRFPVGNQGVHRQMHLYATNMAIFNGLSQGLRREIFRALPGIESAAAKINRIGAILHRSVQSLHRTGGGQQFDHKQYSRIIYLRTL